MTDDDFIVQFENLTLPKESFHHREHVRLAWLYLRSYCVPEALTRFSEGLKSFAAAHGKAGLYHETITWAYMFLVHERMVRGGEMTWEEFALNNPEILNWEQSILNNYYREETLKSETARKIFVFPDR